MPAWPLLLVLSFDGFRYDYLTQTNFSLPNFDILRQRGVEAPLRPQFTSKTWPNHWSMATGLYEESHNVVGNIMHDPVLGDFSLGASNRSIMETWLTSRYSGVPIWNENERGSGKSGVYMWPGTEGAHSKGMNATYLVDYNGKAVKDFNQSADKVVQWLSTGKVNFAMMYYFQPDAAGHQFGPGSPEVARAVKEVDDCVGYLIKRLKGANLWDSLNLIIVSDHGMTAITNVINIADIANDSESVIDNVVLRVEPKPGKEDVVWEKLKKLPNCTVYRKADIPRRYHYRTSVRIPPYVVVPDEGFIFHVDTENFTQKGQHGYDPILESMHGIFFASGPKFKTAYKRKEAIEPVDVHAVMAQVLSISTIPNNGSLARVSDVFKAGLFSNNLTLAIALGVTAAVVLVLAAVGIAFLIRHVVQRLRYRQLNRDEAINLHETSVDYQTLDTL